MMMQKYDESILPIFIALWASLSVTCAGDPWPEPDTMDPHGSDSEPHDGEAGNNEYDTAGSSDSDIDADYDTNKEDTEDESETEGDSDNSGIIDDETGYLVNHVFVSALNKEGLVTVAGLPGAIPDKRTAKCFVGSNDYNISMGLDRSFAMRVPASVDDILTIVVISAGEPAAVFAADIIPDNTVRDWDGLIGTASGATQMDSSYLSIAGRGAEISADMLMIAANITGSNAAAAPVLCEDSVCMFNLLLFGTLTDEIDLFQVSVAERSGTAPVTMPVP